MAPRASRTPWPARSGIGAGRKGRPDQSPEKPLTIIAVAAGLIVGIVQASFFEWTFHRYWLHRPWLPKDVFTAHSLVHHQLCKHDDTFEVHDEEQHEALHFQWWGGPFLILINLTPW